MLQFVPALASAGIQVSCHPLLGNDYVRSLASGERVAPGPILASYFKRMSQLIKGPDCDVIWVYAEAFPYLPAACERLLFRSRKPVVYDFDDAFYVTYDHHPNGWVRRMLSGKLEPLIAGAAAVCAGNHHLLDYARRLNPNCMLMPTVVDTTVYSPLTRRAGSSPVIGWIGSPSTWDEVRPLLPVISAICRDQGVRFRVVGAGVVAESDRFEGMELVEWTEASEVAELQQFDIGIMPLRDMPFQRGKSGYKLVQYMACGLPVVASPVGENRLLVKEGANGFLASSLQDWRDVLAQLVLDPSLRLSLGHEGRKKAEQEYSLQVHAPRLVELFRSLADKS